MSEHGEWIEDWEEADEHCEQCGGDMRYRRWRHNNGTERVLFKCLDCEDSWWVDG